MDLYLFQNGNQVGPYTKEQLVDLVAAGSISRDDIVWGEGLDDWKPIHSIINIPLPNSPNPTTKKQNSSAQRIGNARESAGGGSAGKKVLIYALPILTLILGYFVGREHIKYELRSAFSGAAEVISEGFDIDNDQEENPSPLGEIETSSKPVPEPTQQLMLGETHKAKEFSITLDGARVAKAKVKEMMGDISTGKAPDLILSFTVKNTDERRILRFREGNEFLGGNFKLRDDVDNVIRGMSYGIASVPVGALTGSEDILPGSTATHVELFSVPPPKTEFLVLTIDLACFGGDGEIEFKIPASSITK